MTVKEKNRIILLYLVMEERLLKVVVQKTDKGKEEQVVIQCHAITDKVQQIKKYIQSIDEFIVGVEGKEKVRVFYNDIYYVEAVDNKTFAYLNKRLVTLDIKLYQFEEMAKDNGFVRISKSVILNLNMIEKARSALNGRILLELDNGEKVMVTRHYVSELRKRLRGE